MRKVLTEAVGVAVCFATLVALQQLEDATSPLRLALDELRDRGRGWLDELRTMAEYQAAKDAVLAEAHNILKGEKV